MSLRPELRRKRPRSQKLFPSDFPPDDVLGGLPSGSAVSQVTDGGASCWRPGVRLCLDWGKARIGVAACDKEGVLAYPVETVANDGNPLKRIGELVARLEPYEIIMGMPTDLHGRSGIAAQTMVENAKKLSRFLHRDIRLVDERLTTATAARRLAAAGRDSRQRRSIIDQAAAVAILEQAIEAEKRIGEPPGSLVRVDEMRGDS